ncbi:hypothetical protein [Colwellia echini]|uniref:Uncharacterized protein n=1 Tax=Colwellia echini TaxID=1982103 RepID=A0ABY3MXT7_9GAMM|nr:hypothetical protein [Colwellia echini]TYK66028.1 hypothetical protein CWS31_007070 [Colwellia echini]
MVYTTKFQEALSKTKELALTTESIQFGELLSVEEIKEVLQVCIQALYENGYTNSERLAGKCVPVNMLLNGLLGCSTNFKTYITIGDRYWAENDIYCQMSYQYILNELKAPDFSKPIQAHVWLTLSDGTIIDFTSEAHLDILYKRGDHPVEKCFQVIRPNDVIIEGVHRPFLIGDNFLFKSGAVQLSY